MAIGAQGRAIDPGLGQGRHDLLAVAAQHMGDHGGGGHPYQQHMAQADTVEAVLQRQHPLDFVGFDHGFQHILHGQRRLAIGQPLLGQVIGHSKNAAQIVRRMAPLRGQPGVVEIQPANDAADVPGGFHWIKNERRARYTCAVGYHGALHQWPKMFGAFREAQRQQATTQGVHQAMAGRFHGFP